MKTKKIIFILPEDYTFSIPSLFSFKKKYNYKISGLIFSKGFFDMKKLISIFFLFNFKDHIKFLIKNFIKKEQEQINKIKNINTYDVNSRKVFNFIKKINPDYMIVISSNQILKKKIFDLPKIKTLNFHGSKLPNYRGVLPIFRAYINKDKNFSITLHEVNERIDDGCIRGQYKIKITKNDKLIDLYHKAFRQFPYLLNKTIKNSKRSKNNVKFGSYFSYPTLVQLILFRLREIFN
tara:strand:+ start:267 stop:974 length:708 start_codon:yes stop_codon:yes gene_type:complete